ncbi:MAG: Crp/Fnr family transcriptional regulator [bacterium]
MVKKPKDPHCICCPEAYNTFFSKLTPGDLQFIQSQKTVQHYKKGTKIFLEGSKPQGIFCVKQGWLKIFKNGSDGREHITRLAFPGEFVGLKALLTGTPYSVSAQTLDDSILCFINKNEFLELPLKYAEFTSALISCLSQQLVEAEAKMILLAHKPVRERLAETLLYLYQSHQNRTFSSEEVFLNLSRQDLANIIGTAPETVIRLLGELKENRIISLKGRKIFVHHPERLQKIANSLS